MWQTIYKPQYLQSHPQSLPPLRWWILCWWCAVYGRHSEVQWLPLLQSSSSVWQTCWSSHRLYLSEICSFWRVSNFVQCIEFTALCRGGWDRVGSLCSATRDRFVPVIPFCYIWKRRQDWQECLLFTCHMSPTISIHYCHHIIVRLLTHEWWKDRCLLILVVVLSQNIVCRLIDDFSLLFVKLICHCGFGDNMFPQSSPNICWSFLF